MITIALLIYVGLGCVIYRKNELLIEADAEVARLREIVADYEAFDPEDPFRLGYL